MTNLETGLRILQNDTTMMCNGFRQVASRIESSKGISYGVYFQYRPSQVQSFLARLVEVCTQRIVVLSLSGSPVMIYETK